MKVHSIVDCITNSSSTTFIIALDKMPETSEELHNVLFPKRKQDFVNDFNDKKISSKDIAEIIFKDLQDAERIENKEKVIEELSNSGYFYMGINNGYSEVSKMIKDFHETYGPDAKQADYPEIWEKITNLQFQIKEKNDKYRKEKAKELVEKKWSEFENREIFILDYTDYNWVNAIIETGECFLKIPHFSINNH